MDHHTPTTVLEPTRVLPEVVIGVITDVNRSGITFVSYMDESPFTPVEARSLVPLGPQDVGAEVALVFENADPTRPIVLGVLHKAAVPDAGRARDAERLDPRRAEPGKATGRQVVERSPMEIELEADGQRVVFSAGQEIMLRCGKASITLTRAGKILIRGEYVLSKSEGVNRIQGGSVQIN